MYSRFQALGKYDLDKLQDSTAAVIGLGATGSVIAEHLARHGINLILIDRDYLEMNDLYSSNLYSKDQCENSLPKAKAAEEKLSELTEVKALVENVDSASIGELDVDIILDGTDNMETRLVIEEFSKENNAPWIYTSALDQRGFSMFIQEECFNCMFQDLNPSSSCETDGVMRGVSSIAASTAALKAVKYLSGLEVDEKLEMLPDKKSFEPVECSCEKFEIKASSVCGDGKYQVFGDKRPEDFSENVLVENEYLRKIEYEGKELTVFNSGRAIVHADSENDAERVYREASSI
ncbi:MAG: ThiF family adenylyltransferase [Candidatus Nanohaloarchaea archaeon]